MLDLAGQPVGRGQARLAFLFLDHLSDLLFRPDDIPLARHHRLAVHQGQFGIVMGENGPLQRFDLIGAAHGPGPDKGDFPDINLTVGNHIRTGRGQMPAHPRANAIHRLPHINRLLVQIAQRIDPYLVGQRAKRRAAKALRGCHATASRLRRARIGANNT